MKDMGGPPIYSLLSPNHQLLFTASVFLTEENRLTSCAVQTARQVMAEPEGQGEAMISRLKELNINNTNVEQGIIFILFSICLYLQKID